MDDDLASYNLRLREAVPADLQAAMRSGFISAQAMIEWRSALGFSKAQLARLIGFSDTLIGAIEKGKEPMTAKVQQALRQLATKLDGGLFDELPSPRRFPQLVAPDRSYIEIDRVQARSKNYRKCLNCPKMVLFTSTRQKYCSKACRDDHWRKWRGKRDPADQKIRAGRVRSGTVIVRCPNCAHEFGQKGNLVLYRADARDGGGAPEPAGHVGSD